jgi:hypothetical protein
MILDIWKALKNMRAEYSFESWFYVVIAMLVVVFGLYSCTTMMTRADNTMTKEELMILRQDYLEKKWKVLDEMVEMKVE